MRLSIRFFGYGFFDTGVERIGPGFKRIDHAPHRLGKEGLDHGLKQPGLKFEINVEINFTAVFMGQEFP